MSCVEESVRPGTHDLRLVLRTGSIIKGVVRDTEGAPIASAAITWRHAFSASPFAVTTSSQSDGRFELVGDRVFSVIEASATGFAPRMTDLSPEETTHSIDIVLRDGVGIVGRVVRAEGGSAIPDASVELWEYAGPGASEYGIQSHRSRKLMSMKTNAAGMFAFSHAPDDAPSDRPLPPAFPHRALWVSAPAFASAWHEVPLANGSVPAEITVALFDAVSIEGRVVDSAGSPVAGCLVEVDSTTAPLCRTSLKASDLRWQIAFQRTVGGAVPTVPLDEAQSAITDRDGSYAIASVPCSFSAPLKITVTARAEPSASVEALVSPGKPVAIPAIVLPLVPGVEGSGTVRDPGGAPIEAALVNVGFEQAVTDQAGRFVVSRSTAYGAVTPPQWAMVWTQCRGFCGGVRWATWDELKSGTLVITLQRATDLRGRVVDADGRPVPNAVVSAVPNDLPVARATEYVEGHGLTKQISTASSDHKGLFLLRDVPSVTCIVVSFPTLIAEPTYRVVFSDAVAGESPIVVRIADLHLQGEGMGTVHVAIVGDDGVPADGPSSATLSTAGAVRYAASSPGSLARFSEVLAGTYDLEAWSAGLGVKNVGAVVVAPGRTARIDVQMSVDGAATLEVRFVNEAGAAPQDNVEALIRRDGRVAGYAVASAGQCRFGNLPPGQYTLELNREPGAWWKGPPLTPRWVEQKIVTVDVRPGVVTEEVLLVTPAKILSIRLSRAGETAAGTPPALLAGANEAWASRLVVRVTSATGQVLFEGRPRNVTADVVAAEVPLSSAATGPFRVDVSRAGTRLASQEITGTWAPTLVVE